MATDAFRDIERLESDLWEAADNLRANSKLTSSDYFMPVLGVIFLRHAANRFAAAERQIAADQAGGKMPQREVKAADFVARRALYLPERARFDEIMRRASVGGSDLPTLLNQAMIAIEESFAPLRGVLPRDYGIFEPKVLEDLMRLFNSDQIQQATGDVFGRIYEYFLAKFSVQKAHDNGEFFTPSSIVQTIVNVIEPDHGKILDPACGSGGMFVQSSHFIEQEGLDTAKRVSFYGQEKNRDTIRIAKMNLAVHGLEGDIAEAITYYSDMHNLWSQCDFVMANPPFNVDKVDAERVKTDRRLPFGLPGVNKQKQVSNGNYLWISYFWSYLNPRGRAGFVMSSQASSAGHGEKEVRRKIVETGDVDVMIAIRSNFFYTRTVPCELWHFDRAKPPERRDKVLMLDARNVYRKVTRKIYDFSPEQMRNLAAIVWLYRGQQDRFLGLIGDYLGRVCAEAAEVPAALAPFEGTLAELSGRFEAAEVVAQAAGTANGAHAGPHVEAIDAPHVTAASTELREAAALYAVDARRITDALAAFGSSYADTLPVTNDAQHAARTAFDPTAEGIRGLIKQIDLLYKLAARAVDEGDGLAAAEGKAATVSGRGVGKKLIKRLDEQRRDVVEQLKQVAYFHRQVTWLQDRFPDAELRAVAGLVKLVDRDEIEAADWSLTPGRFVGVAPQEDDGDFDFGQAMRDIQVELAELNSEAVALAERIQARLEGLAT